MRWSTTWRSVAAGGTLAMLVASGIGPASADSGLTATATTTTDVAQGASTRLAGAGGLRRGRRRHPRGHRRDEPRDPHRRHLDGRLAGLREHRHRRLGELHRLADAGGRRAGRHRPHGPRGMAGLSATVTLTAYLQGPASCTAPPPTTSTSTSVLGRDLGLAAAGASGGESSGKTGYLVTITSSAENAIVTSRIPNAENVWIGAEARRPPAPRRDLAVGGRSRGGPGVHPVFRLARLLRLRRHARVPNWSSGEPNNADTSRGGEWVAVTNWNGYNGRWNDLAATNTGAIAGYVVEYGDGSAFADVATASASVAIVGVPGAPTGVSASPGSEQATVTFTAPASDGSSAVTGYTVTASPGGATASCAASPCTVTGLTAWQAYTFTVAAANAIGASPASSPSAQVTVWPQPSPPGSPSGMSTTPVVGAAYSDAVAATGFPAPTFAVTGGAMPAGLGLDASTGAVTGTATTAGPWSVEITATSSEGSAAATLSGYVGSAPTAITGSLGNLPIGEAVTVDPTLTATPRLPGP